MSTYDEQNNFSHDPELLNYKDTENIITNNNSFNYKENDPLTGNAQNINESNPQNNNIQNKDEALDMELSNVQMLILHRSLYILKKKFEMNKKELEIIYQKYRDENYIKIKCIKVDFLLELYKEIMDTTQFTMLPYLNFNELITADLMTEINADKTKMILKDLVQFTQNNVEKYNRLYFEKKMRKKKLIEENEKNKKDGNLPQDEAEYTSEVQIIKMNKRGKIIRNFQEMIENNKEFEVGENIIVTINEDDMSILNNDKLLYSEVIPLIIADFLQGYLKNNEYVAIVSTSTTSDDPENYKLNQNIKSLFDNDIIKIYNNLNKANPNEEKKEKLKNLLYELMNIENQIKIYQNLVLEKTAKGNNVKHLMNMVKKLNEQKAILQKKINQFSSMGKKSKQDSVLETSMLNTNNTNSIFSQRVSADKNLLKKNSNSKSNRSIGNTKNSKYKLGNSKVSATPNRVLNINNINNLSPNSQSNKNGIMTEIYGPNSGSNYLTNGYYNYGMKDSMTKEELRNNNLLDIFYFYTKQHSFIGKTPTFEELLKSEEHLDLAEFGKFCVEFKIMVKPHKIAEIFKKTAINSKKLNYAMFIQTLQKLSISANDEKKQYLMERIKIYKMKLKELNEKNKKNGIIENENDPNKSKEKEENLSGIKSEGEVEDEEKCQQEKNLENQNQEENKVNSNENNNDKKSSNSKGDNDKKSINSKNNDKKSSFSNNNELEKINENEEENLKNNENNENNLNEENNNNKEELKSNNSNKQNQNNDNGNKHVTTNQKYYHQNKAKLQSKNKKQKKNTKLVKPKTNSFLMMETKEELEEKISKLTQDYNKLDQKTHTQLEEEFYQYLEIDDTNLYRKKMVGYINPFQIRDKISRFPLQNVARPVKRDPKMQKEMHKILVQRHEELKKEKELKQLKEKRILFEKRKKQFEIENKKIQQKMSVKNDYIQFRKKEEDYQKEKNSKITWQQIQNCDYDNFILNEKDKSKNSNLDEIFTNKSNQFDGDDGDYLKNFRLKKGFSENASENIKNNDNKANNNFNLENNMTNNLNIYENINKTEPVVPKFDSNISNIISENIQSNNSEYDIVNSIGTDK